jgi:hypothetical protein
LDHPFSYKQGPVPFLVHGQYLLFTFLYVHHIGVYLSVSLCAYLQEIMKKNRLGLRFIVEELTKEYDATRNLLNNAIPSVRISKR